MKKKTKKLTKQLGKSKTQKTRAKQLAKIKRNGAGRRGSGSGSKKNYRHITPIAFTVSGKRHLKFCKTILLTTQLRKLLGRAVTKIILPEIRQNAAQLPVLSIFCDTKNRQLIIRNDLVEHEDYIVTDKDGNSCFKEDRDFAANYFKTERRKEDES